MSTATRTRRSYSRDDVQTHYEHGTAHPAVNIKRHLWESGDTGDFPTSLLTEVADEHGHDADEFVTWWRTMAETDEDAFDRMLDTYRGFACEVGFEDARSDLEAIFPIAGTVSPMTGRWSKLDVWQEGRSGGWLVVHGLPDIDTWDAVTLAKWRRFERYVRSAVDCFAESVVVLVAINAYESHLDDVARAKAWHEVGRWEHLLAGTPLAGLVEMGDLAA